jgi:invasion protein IalB
MRKKVNAHRRRYQRTRCTALREQRKEQYKIVKAEYANTIKKEKYESWKKFCTLTSATNPWSGIYRIMAGRRNQMELTTTLRKKDGTMTSNLQETLQYMLQNLTPEDKIKRATPGRRSNNRRSDRSS